MWLTGRALGRLQIWAVNAAGQLELTFTHPEEEQQADSRNVSVGGVFPFHGGVDAAGLWSDVFDKLVKRSRRRVLILTGTGGVCR